MKKPHYSVLASALLLAIPALCRAEAVAGAQPATTPLQAPPVSGGAAPADAPGKAAPAQPAAGTAPDNTGGMAFSASQLKALGIDPAVAAYFAKGPRFSPGMTDVEVSLNGVPRSNARVRITEQGELCADDAFMAAVGVRQPPSLFTHHDADDCAALKKSWPGASLSLLPATQRVSVVVPPAAAMDDHDPSRFEQGGVGALMNYSGYDSRFSSSAGQMEYRSLSLDGGFNVAGWMLRGARTFSQSSEGASSSQSAYLYARRVFTGIRKLFEIGQISFSGYTLAGAPINGIRLAPESGLEDADSGVSVSGIAPADQSRVEVRQNGIVIQSTLVPAGPFTLNNLPVLNSAGSLELTITSPGGSTSHRTISAETFRRQVGRAPSGFSLAMGEVRSTGSREDDTRPRVLSLSDGWNVLHNVMVTADGVVATLFHAVGTHVNWNPTPSVSLGSDLAFSRDTRHDLEGAKAGVDATWMTPLGVSVSGNVMMYSPGYRELTDTLNSGVSYNRYSAGMSLGWSDPTLGSFSLSGGQARSSGHRTKSLYYMASWSHSLPRGSVAVTWQHQDTQTLQCEAGRPCSRSDRNSLFVNLSVPLGGVTTGAYYRTDDDRSTAGVRASGGLTENSDWSLSAEHAMKGSSTDNLSGGLTSNLHYTTLGMYGSVDGDHSRNLSATLAGGMVAGRHGLTLSPERVSDTFGVVSVTPATSGIEFDTPGGKAWTDWAGHAVVPSLPAWHTSRVEMNTEHLPAHVDVTNGYRKINAGRGAVTDTQFSLQKTRNALLMVKRPDGSLLPSGSTINDGGGHYITTAVDAGTVFINNLDEVHDLNARWSSGDCHLVFSVPERAPDNSSYEQINAVCR